jgi:hypothetical protein
MIGRKSLSIFIETTIPRDNNTQSAGPRYSYITGVSNISTQFIGIRCLCEEWWEKDYILSFVLFFLIEILGNPELYYN